MKESLSKRSSKQLHATNISDIVSPARNELSMKRQDEGALCNGLNRNTLPARRCRKHNTINTLIHDEKTLHVSRASKI